MRTYGADPVRTTTPRCSSSTPIFTTDSPLLTPARPGRSKPQLIPRPPAPARPCQADRLSDLADQLTGQPRDPASRATPGSTPASTYRRAALRSPRLLRDLPQARPRRPGTQNLTNLDHGYLPERHPPNPPSRSTWRHPYRPATTTPAKTRRANPPLATRWSHARGRNPQSGPMHLAGDKPEAQ
jgi:hypothetical protein